jgi:hypothetical protein
VQVADPQLAEVVEALADPGQGARKPVGVADVADHRRVLEPVRPQAALQVKQLQLLVALPVALGEQDGDALQQGRQVVAVAVGAAQALGQVMPPSAQAGQEQVDVAVGQPGEDLSGPAPDLLGHPTGHRPS